ncbi:MAG: RNase P subunit p30 family protein [Promethearchaeota archaeon]
MPRVSKKIYARINLNWNDPERDKAFLEMLRKVGFRGACVELPRDKRPRDLEGLSEAVPIELYPRRTIFPRNRGDLIGQLNKTRGFRYVVVGSDDVDVVEAAIRDTRVDAIGLTAGRGMPKLTRGIVSLVRQGGKAFDLLFHPLLSTSGFRRAKVIRKMAKNLRLVKPDRTPLIFGSNARNAGEVFAPMHFVALAKEMFGVSINAGKMASSNNIVNVVERSAFRQSPNYVMEGVMIVDDPGEFPETVDQPRNETDGGGNSS